LPPVASLRIEVTPKERGRVGGFELVCEVEPPTRPDLVHVRHQIGVLSKVASSFLIPDNHLGRATVSSVAVAHEVAAMGGRSIACLNGRDRNRLGLRRDLLTAAAYGVDQFLLVAGDRRPDEPPGVGVRAMIDEIREFETTPPFAGRSGFRLGATTRLGRVAPFKLEADFLFVQVSFDVDALVAWRDTVRFAGPVLAGVMVLASPAMARRIGQTITEVDIPAETMAQLERDPLVGVELACEQVEAIRESGAFDGVHLVPVSRYREVAARLERGR
jgi:methylenetetrahydrofolate reductase (NADPH)